MNQVDQAMSVSIKVQKSVFEFPFERRNFVAEAWRDSVLIWGGFTDGLRAPHDPKVVQYSDRKSGGWIAKSTRGDYPPWSSSLHVLTAHVLNDKLYVLGFEHLQRAEPVLIYSLDLNSWTWIKISPSGTTGSSKTLGTILRDPIVPSSAGQVGMQTICSMPAAHQIKTSYVFTFPISWAFC